MKLKPLIAIGIGCAAGVLTACSPAPQSGELVQPKAVEVAIQPGAASVIGKVVESDWYVVIAAGKGVKPLVIWSASHGECTSSANEFNIKAVVPDNEKKAAPAARCVKGDALPALLAQV